MVRINLISSEQTRKKKRGPIEIQNQMILASVVLSVVVLLLGSGWILLDRKLASLDTEKTEKLKAIEVLKAQIKEVENYERDKKTVAERIGVIKQLRANQAVPVQLLDGISAGIPSRVWLIGITENAGMIDLSGRSMTNGEIADFVQGLRNNPAFKAVQLVESRQEREGDVVVYAFRLTFSVLS
ncbi:MAG: PilN domain-containing protein [Nitrospirae bacterium]|nr:PilN domain-containing protein [Candidatus Troglogloeales bacterium]MBI3597980.1 PilN domain-containing protein [Candidatus Troglogloeales bacterium]